MSNTTVTLQIDTQDLVKVKFIKTLTILEGYFKEAAGDREINQSYSANAVYTRLDNIRITLNKDLENMANSIGIIYGPQETETQEN